MSGGTVGAIAAMAALILAGCGSPTSDAEKPSAASAPTPIITPSPAPTPVPTPAARSYVEVRTDRGFRVGFRLAQGKIATQWRGTVAPPRYLYASAIFELKNLDAARPLQFSPTESIGQRLLYVGFAKTKLPPGPTGGCPSTQTFSMEGTGSGRGHPLTSFGQWCVQQVGLDQFHEGTRIAPNGTFITKPTSPMVIEERWGLKEADVTGFILRGDPYTRTPNFSLVPR